MPTDPLFKKVNAPLFQKVNSSDYISYKKRITIAGEYEKVADTNPVKMNGSQYNKNFKFLSAMTPDISNCLIQAQSYELKQDYTSGVDYIHIVCDLSGNVLVL
jgi:hypothetical protein